jgi:hypothetical protein
MGDRYERVYDVGLLDDLHNYFPGLLYEPDRFRTVSDVLNYIRQNTSRRFNLFDYGARQHLQQQQNTRAPSTTVPQNTFMRQTPVVNRWTPPVTQPNHLEFDLTNAVDIALLAPLLRSLDRIVGTEPAPPPPMLHTPIQRVGGNRFAGLFQDIVVHASQELIDSASSVRTLLMDLEESCSICQDRMRQGENIRRLNACQHEFHGACVDNWFLQRSVVCPVCRHDIRDLTPVLRSPRLASTPAAPAVPPVTLNPEQETDEESDETTSQPPASRLRSRTDINSMFNRRLE